jgi:hypothetical protein
MKPPINDSGFVRGAKYSSKTCRASLFTLALLSGLGCWGCEDLNSPDLSTNQPQSPKGIKMFTRYFRAFQKYTVPAKPSREITYVESESLKVLYRANYDDNGILITWWKLQRIEKPTQIPSEFVSILSKDCYLSAVEEVDRYVPGEVIDYSDTENMEYYFRFLAAVPNRLTMIQQQITQDETYEYWEDGVIRRCKRRMSGTEDVVYDFSKNGQLIRKNGQLIK